MFPGGNAGIARQILKVLIPDAIPSAATMSPAICRSRVQFAALDRKRQRYARVRVGSTVFSVKHEEAKRSQAVQILYINGGKPYRLQAKGVVMAGGSWTASIVRDVCPVFAGMLTRSFIARLV